VELHMSASSRDTAVLVGPYGKGVRMSQFGF
jgi:hypothetical protein